MILTKPYGRHWFHCNPVLPTVFEDSLSYYELLCKIHRWLIEVSNYLETNDFITRPELTVELNNLRDELNDRIDNLGDELLDKIRPELAALKQGLADLAEKVESNNQDLQNQIADVLADMAGLTELVYTLTEQNKEWLEQKLLETTYTYSSFNGAYIPVTQLLHLAIQEIRVNGLSADEYDELELTATAYDGKQWTAYFYAWQTVAHYEEV